MEHSQAAPQRQRSAPHQQRAKRPPGSPISNRLSPSIINGNSIEGRFYLRYERALIAHCGGAPSVAQKRLIERASMIAMHLLRFDQQAQKEWPPQPGEHPQLSRARWPVGEDPGADRRQARWQGEVGFEARARGPRRQTHQNAPAEPELSLAEYLASKKAAAPETEGKPWARRP